LDEESDKVIAGEISTESTNSSTVNQSLLRPIILSDEQRDIYKIMERTNEHLFITGKAGTGKSSLLNYFKGYTEKKSPSVR
jgi:predicted GTPase